MGDIANVVVGNPTKASEVNAIIDSLNAQHDGDTGTHSTITVSGTATFNGIATFLNTGLHILDAGGDHDLIIKPGSDVSVDRTLTITTGDANRTITLSGNLTVESASLVNQDLTTDAAGVRFATLGIGLALTDGTLHVHTATAGVWAPSVNADNLIVETDGVGGVSIATPNANAGNIHFSSPARNGGYTAFIQGKYNGGADQLFLGTNSGPTFRMESGKVSIGTDVAPDGTLHVHTATAGIWDPSVNADNLIVETGGVGGISIATPNGDAGNIHFSSPARDGGYTARIQGKYNGGTDQLFLATNAAQTFRMESGKVSIGTDVAPDGTLHVHTATAGAWAPHADVDNLIVESGGNMGVSLASPNANSQNLYFSCPARTGSYVAYIQGFYNAGTDQLMMGTNGNANTLRLESGIVYVNDTSNAGMTQGITINQGANDNEILAFRSSDVGHAMTTYAETTIYGSFGKVAGADGGLYIRGYSDATAAVEIRGYAVTVDTTDPPDANTVGVVTINAVKRSGGGPNASGLGVADNLFTVTNLNAAKFVIKGDGETYSSSGETNPDVATYPIDYDFMDDAAALLDIRSVIAKGRDIKKAGRKLLHYNKDFFVKHKFMSHDGMLSNTKMMWLQVGAIGQVYQRLNTLEVDTIGQLYERINALESMLSEQN